MKKYKVAVIVAGIDESYQSTILHGIESAAEECMLDLVMFASFSGTMGNLNHDYGEYNIFRLPDFSTFDGAILLTNTIDDKRVVENIRSRIREEDLPAPLRGAPIVMIAAALMSIAFMGFADLAF